MYIKGVVTIKSIDRRTNKIVKKITSNNTMLKNGAYCLMYGLTGIQSPSPITKIVLFNKNKGYMKCLDANVTLYDGPGCLFTAIDDSFDFYEVWYLALSTTNVDRAFLGSSYFVAYLEEGGLKDFWYKVSIEWEVWISYSEPP